MKSLQRQEKIVEKVLKTKAGQYVHAVFLVYEVNGNLKARLISAKPVLGSSFKKTIVCLPVVDETSTQAIASTKRSRTLFHYNNIFSFFNSQPTRAPSL